ncbi:alpha/beta-hydrolase [Aspergillus heteromorphus CBS 117.55]|uniref:Alpha/beta-hydrolase n=1 Tax=Aspergillus heteromorphus CBS 117.55 TaxID=1448321 RepID=A0A317VVU3_9EURO|nr:alpha/beta-hydrolase [Aspergillus heteromorphus CBS 117.55]PWY77018.1 alpha/beta-hydrolase [Aspergillus heteromorphus CBS 117.55]
MLHNRSIALAILPLLLLLIARQPVSSSQQIQTLFASRLPVPLRDVLLANRPRVTLVQGTVVGTILTDTLKNPVDAFRGIPYALPPTGDRRFRRAVAVNASDDIIDVSEFGPRCPGKQLLNPKDTGGNEDCLTVNIFRPHGVEGKLPVAVYVHGGAYNRGTASMHNTASMVGWSDEPFIAVSFNYRIGALGFLPSTLSAEEGILNLGLHDQLLLFQWVQDNIPYFNGDPSKVTLIGLSAGAHSIAHHITTPGNPLFHRAIIESGSATSRALHPYNAPIHESQFQDFLALTNCISLPSSATFQCLRSLPASTIITASTKVFDKYNPSVRWAFQPVIDHELITRPPIDAWHAGAWNKMPILTGFNSNEGTYYVPRDMNSSAEFRAFFRTLLPAYSEEDIATIEGLYPDPQQNRDSEYLETRELDVGRQFKRVEAAYGHYAYVCPVRRTALFASGSGSVSGLGSEQPVWLYHWSLNKTVLGGANHGDQMEYETFNPSVREFSDTQEELAGVFHAYVTSFVVFGDPNVLRGRWGGRPRWEGYGEGNKQGDGYGEARNHNGQGRLMVFGEGNDERAGGDSVGVVAAMTDDVWAREECGFWGERSGVSD